MGLLDYLNTDDGRLAAGLLAAAGPSRMPVSFGQGLLSAVNNVQQMKEQDAVAQMRKAQLAQMAFQQQQAMKAAQQAELDQQLTRKAFTPVQPIEANQASGITGPRPEALQSVGQMPQFDPRQFIASGGSAPLAFQLEQSVRKDTSPIKLGAGESLYDPKTLKQLANNPKEMDLPSAVKEYQFAQAQGYKGSLQDFILEQKRAGATNLSVSMDKGFGTTFADNAAKDLGASRDRARGAANTLTTLNNIDKLMDSGNVATGPTQPFQVFGLQLGQALGVNGKDGAERLGNTRQLIQQAAALSIDGAKAMAGQGQISDGERRLILRASGGDIDTMTPPEIKALTGALRKVNQATMAGHKSLLSNVGPQFKSFTPFYEVQAPEDYVSPSGGWSIKPKGQ